MRVRVTIEREPADSADDIVALFRTLVRIVSELTRSVTIVLTDRSH